MLTARVSVNCSSNWLISVTSAAEGMATKMRIEKRLLTITDEVTPKPLNRVVSALLEMQNTGKSEIKVTQSQLGHESGVSRLQAHRALKELQTQKIISLAYRAINVEDQSALEDLAVKH
jgi:hypothetical protein